MLSCGDTNELILNLVKICRCIPRVENSDELNLFSQILVIFLLLTFTEVDHINYKKNNVSHLPTNKIWLYFNKSTDKINESIYRYKFET